MYIAHQTGQSLHMHLFTADMSDKYGLHINGNKLIYWKADHAVYLYDTTTATETKLLTDASDARWYDSNTIIF